MSKIRFNWQCKSSWKKSAQNTAICLLGCAIGDNSTILFFQLTHIHAPMMLIMLTAMAMGLLTSITLETILLIRQMPFKLCLKVALGMSIISMLMMESSANLTSLIFAGGNRLILTWESIIPSWAIGFLSAWVYNYYQLKRYGKACHG
ncbi:DUF4396 domain-containing protein [Candidatus Dependentiae bacterium]|nr:DUF4396 domain-containing protein [Candidatus Dependentiae bacterium]